MQITKDFASETVTKPAFIPAAPFYDVIKKLTQHIFLVSYLAVINPCRYT